MTRLRRPCANCPWRVDAPREHWDPQHFVDIFRNCRQDGMHIMLCHKTGNQSKATAPVCQGWIRVMRFNAIGVRIAAMRGRVTLEEIHDHGGPQLFSGFEEMMRANRVWPTED